MTPQFHSPFKICSASARGGDRIRLGEAANPTAQDHTPPGKYEADQGHRVWLSQRPWTWVSHEMRTPLNAILGFVQILQSEPQTPRQAAELATIRASSEHLLALVNNTLDLASVEAGALRLRPRPTALAALLETVGDIGRVLARQKALPFHWEIGPNLPAVIIVDDLRLRQVLLNLVGNAVKFTPGGDVGHVTLRVRAVPTDDRQARMTSGPASKVRLSFEVEDQGIGLSEPQLQRLFQPFDELTDPPWPDCGTGLGLAISQDIVRLMGGEIAVRSVPGEGSSFAFQLDLAAVEEAGVAAPAAWMSLLAADLTEKSVDSVSGEGVILPRDEVELLHRLAQRGDIRAIRTRAEYLLGLKAQYRPFAERLAALARECEIHALTALIERSRTGLTAVVAPQR